MKMNIRFLLTVSILAIVAAPWLWADEYLKNTDFKNGFSSWRGSGSIVFLKADGTEGADGDADVTPVIKISLSRGESRSIYQEFETRDKPTSLHVKVDVLASADFKRSPNPDDYNTVWKAGEIWYWTAMVIPKCDFWIRGGTSTWFYKVVDLKPTVWTTVEGHFENQMPDLDRVVNFCVPAGQGTVYLKNPVVDP